MTPVLKILLLAHDVSDSAIARRITMLQTGGAQVTVAGFRRTLSPITMLNGCPVTDFGATRNGGFVQRIAMVARTMMRLRRYRQLFDEADIVIGRNLEMLALAVAGAARAKRRPSVIYECLDLHRLLLAQTVVGAALRGLERFLLCRSRGIVTSSPAFIEQYFLQRNPTALPIRLIENKLPPTTIDPHTTAMRSQPPWVIGWFGILRCRKSLHILQTVVQNNPGRVEVVMRGRPALDQIPEFHNVIAATPGLRFDGPYRHPDDLAAMYGGVHFNWAIDLYEEGLNSAWLLPNRLYEGGAYGAVPLALAAVETGRTLAQLGTGVLLAQPLIDSMQNFLRGLTSTRYGALAASVQAVPPSRWRYNQQDCHDLVRWLQQPGGVDA